MWFSTHSTGIEQLDLEHQKIDALIRRLPNTSKPSEEKKYLIDLYCVINQHLRNKAAHWYQPLTYEEEEKDQCLLETIRNRIKAREIGCISQREFIDALRKIFAEHVLAGKNLHLWKAKETDLSNKIA